MQRERTVEPPPGDKSSFGEQSTLDISGAVQGRGAWTDKIERETLAHFLRESPPQRLVYCIDCRFQYEFEGGRIGDALLVGKDDLAELFFTNFDLIKDPNFYRKITESASVPLTRARIQQLVAEFRGTSAEVRTSLSNGRKKGEGVQTPSSTEAPKIARSLAKFFPQPSRLEQNFDDYLGFEKGLSNKPYRPMSGKKPKGVFGVLGLGLGSKEGSKASISPLNQKVSLENARKAANGCRRPLHRNLSLQRGSGEAPATPESSLPVVVVFYCEFSSKRAPAAFEHFRSLDREFNQFRFPHLSYPQSGVLRGGYCEFVRVFSELCHSIKGISSKYRPMTPQT